ncbi:MAG: histidine kinase [Proteobacteria bacterium]|nr:histidine kinase [Pseudomonadota bacterium]
MPSLIRLIAAIAVIAAIGYGTVYSLATYFQPKPREISVTVSPDKFIKQ